MAKGLHRRKKSILHRLMPWHALAALALAVALLTGCDQKEVPQENPTPTEVYIMDAE